MHFSTSVLSTASQNLSKLRIDDASIQKANRSQNVFPMNNANPNTNCTNLAAEGLQSTEQTDVNANRNIQPGSRDLSTSHLSTTSQNRSRMNRSQNHVSLDSNRHPLMPSSSSSMRF